MSLRGGTNVILLFYSEQYINNFDFVNSLYCSLVHFYISSVIVEYFKIYFVFLFYFFHRFNIFKAFMDKIRRIFESLFGYNSSVSKFKPCIRFPSFKGVWLNNTDIYAY